MFRPLCAALVCGAVCLSQPLLLAQDFAGDEALQRIPEVPADVSADDATAENAAGEESLTADADRLAMRSALARDAAPSGGAAPAPKPPAKPTPPPAPYKPLFYDNDFSYLSGPNPGPWFPGDAFKQLQPAPGCTLDTGGEIRFRDHHEHELRGSNLSGNSDDFLLQRMRLFGNLKLGSAVRIYGEAIDAVSSFENDPPRTIEENRFDALNLFGDLLVFETGDGKFYGRAGRQEVLYGAERLVSPLDWANTRRTFDGAKMYYRGKRLSVDSWWLRPVPFGQHINNDHNFDAPDQSQEFVGVYISDKLKPNHTLDYYYLRLAEHDAPGSPANPVNFDVNLFGGRWLGRQGNWLCEFEGGYQLGTYGAQAQEAGFAVVGGGHEWSRQSWKPTLWCYYDWASGDQNPTDAKHNTFNQLFPLAHKYFGFMDLIARQNIQDFNCLLTATPTKKTKALVWWHVFHLAEARDALYNAAGVPFRSDPTGASGTDVGQELDLLWQVQVNPRADVLFGYSHFWAGAFVEATNPAGVSGDADFYYSQWSYRF